MITDKEIREIYHEDTVGRKYHTPIITKNKSLSADGENGELVSINLDEPMTWKQFKTLSDATKVQYITGLKNKYNVTQTELVKMLGCSRTPFYKLVVRGLSLTNLFPRYETMSTNQLKEWKKFVNCGKEIIEPVETVKKSVENRNQASTNSNCTSFSFTCKGELNTTDLVNKILAMMSNGTPCTVSVSVITEE